MDNYFEHFFEFSQNQVEQFAEATGDKNPIHLDNEYAKQSIFGRTIVHGALSSSVFSKVFGTINPGEGTIYLSQSTTFLKPMFTKTPYKAIFSVIEKTPKGKAILKTDIIETKTNILTVTGEAVLKLPKR